VDLITRDGRSPEALEASTQRIEYIHKAYKATEMASSLPLPSQ
jgi:hypothetical protein